MTNRAKIHGVHDGQHSAERAATEGPVLRLYVAGAAPHSAQALANLKTMLNRELGAQYELDVVDVLREPVRALRDGILVTPTLVKLSPPPAQTIVGDLSASAVVLRALGFTH